MSKPVPEAAPTPPPKKRRTLQDVHDRIVRVESRLVKLMLAAGLDADGNPKPRHTGK